MKSKIVYIEVVMKKRNIIIIVSDILILLGMVMATNLLSGYLIPYINYTYKLTANEVGTSDMMAYLFSGAKWFTTSLQGYELPEPIEEISSRLENYLDRFDLRKEEVQEVETEPEYVEPVPTEFHSADANRHAISWYKEFNGHTYRIYDEFINLKNAENHCESMGGHLVTITSQEELDFVCGILAERYDVIGDTSTYHIGLLYDGLQYSWITGESTEFINAVHSDQAGNLDYGEGVLRLDGRMNAGMIIAMPYICEWE